MFELYCHINNKHQPWHTTMHIISHCISQFQVFAAAPTLLGGAVYGGWLGGAALIHMSSFWGPYWEGRRYAGKTLLRKTAGVQRDMWKHIRLLRSKLRSGDLSPTPCSIGQSKSQGQAQGSAEGEYILHCFLEKNSWKDALEKEKCIKEEIKNKRQ